MTTVPEQEARLVEDCSRVLVPEGQEWRDCCDQCRGAAGLWVITSAKPQPKQGEGPRIQSQRDSKSTPMSPGFLTREENNNCDEYVLEWLLKHFAKHSQVLDKHSLSLWLISCMRLWPDVIPCKGTKGCGPWVSLRGQMGQG